MSKIEVDAIEPQSGTDLTIGASGDTITIPSGATLANSGIITGFESTGIDDNATSTAVTIDSSGNLLVGKTAPAFATVGGELRENGQITGTRDDGASLILNRLTSNGEIAKFYKDGTNVGDIGTVDDAIFIGNFSGNPVGMKFAKDSTARDIRPCNADGSDQDNLTDLGDADARWNDLFLGGGVYLGGTLTANKLDDYEAGAFTPAYSAGGGFSATYAKQIGNYTKIGNKVTCWLTLFTNTVSLTSAANLTISGLPFVAASGDVQLSYSATIGRNYRWSSNIDLQAVVGQGNSSVTLYYQDSNAINLLPAQTSQLTSGSNGFYNNIDITITYQTA